MSEAMFDVGKIVNTHGVRGEVKVKRITDFEDRFAVGSMLYITLEDQNSLELEIDGHRQHQQFDLLHFKGYDNINDVELFKGAYLKIKEEQLTPLAEGEYYYHEIIGCEMYTTSGEKIGEITSILSPGANDVWVIERPNGKEALIPFIKDVVKDVNVGSKKVTIELMEGLLD